MTKNQKLNIIKDMQALRSEFMTSKQLVKIITDNLIEPRKTGSYNRLYTDAEYKLLGDVVNHLIAKGCIEKYISVNHDYKILAPILNFKPTI